MTSHITKTWFEDGKLITQVFEEKDIYKREWVGLTNEEVRQMCGSVPSMKEAVREAEAKLKELNG